MKVWRVFKNLLMMCIGSIRNSFSLDFLKVLKGSYMESQKERYGLVYKSRPPYEVLYTNWLSYEEMMRLKSVEEMVEVYYNSGQFSYCLRKLEEEYASPFVLYQELADIMRIMNCI